MKHPHAILIFGFVLSFLLMGCGGSILPPTPTPAPPTLTPPPPLLFDFESDTQGWGEHPNPGLLKPGKGVIQYCDKQKPIVNTGDCSLQFNPTQMSGSDAFVSVSRNSQNSIITAYVYVPSEAEVCSGQNCSTAKIILWDKNYTSYESDYVTLSPGVWTPITWDVRNQSWSGPWAEFGIHFYLLGYRGPLYIDNVTVKY